MRKLAGILGALTLLLAGVVLLSGDRAGAAEFREPRRGEAQFLRLLNGERTRRGLGPLARDPGLDVAAREWSNRMAATYDRTGTVLAPGERRGDCVHSALCHRPDLAAVIGAVEPAWRAGGENVGTGFEPAALHRAFVRSPGHLANIVGDWNRVGIGLVVRPDGRSWVSFLFLRGPALSGPA
jgi:uncharacterized protein YkwD